MAVSQYALTDVSNVVQNIVLWDGTSDWPIPNGLTARLIAAQVMSPGDTFDGVTVTPAPPTQTEVEDMNRLTLLGQANQAVANNITFLAIGIPTNLQVVAQVQALTKQVDALLKIAANLLADTSGT